MNKGIAIAFVAALSSPQSAVAQEPDQSLERQLARYLFPPAMVMRYERRLSLTDEQRATVNQRARELQTAVLDLQLELQHTTQELVELVAGDSVDTDAALQQIDRVLDLEARIKRNHLRALIEIRNALSASQRDTLSGIMAEMLRRGETGEGEEEPIR